MPVFKHSTGEGGFTQEQLDAAVAAQLAADFAKIATPTAGQIFKDVVAHAINAAGVQTTVTGTEIGSTAQFAELVGDVQAQVNTGYDSNVSICGIIAFDHNDVENLCEWILSHGPINAATESIVGLPYDMKGPIIFANLASLTYLVMPNFTNMIYPPDVSTCSALATLDLSGCTGLDAADLQTLFGYLTGAYVPNAAIDIHNTAVPNAATMSSIYYLCTTNGMSVTCDAPPSVTSAGVTDPVTAGAYVYTPATGLWDGPGTKFIYHDGTHYRLDAGANTWTGPAASITGVYTPDGTNTGNATVSITP
jgi:hypothetical protein